MKLRGIVTAMSKTNYRPLLVSLYLDILLCPATDVAERVQRQATGRNQPPPQAAGGQPRLVVVIVVDQFRYDFLERFADLYGKNGFKRLMDRGALFTNAN